MALLFQHPVALLGLIRSILRRLERIVVLPHPELFGRGFLFFRLRFFPCQAVASVLGLLLFLLLLLFTRVEPLGSEGAVTPPPYAPPPRQHPPPHVRHPVYRPRRIVP